MGGGQLVAGMVGEDVAGFGANCRCGGHQVEMKAALQVLIAEVLVSLGYGGRGCGGRSLNC